MPPEASTKSKGTIAKIITRFQKSDRGRESIHNSLLEHWIPPVVAMLFWDK